MQQLPKADLSAPTNLSVGAYSKLGCCHGPTFIGFSLLAMTDSQTGDACHLIHCQKYSCGPLLSCHQVDAHLANHITSLKLHHTGSLTAPSSVSQTSLPQLSRLAALNLPLTLPPLPGTTDVAPTTAKVQQRATARGAKPPLVPAKTAPLRRLLTEPLPEQAVSVAVAQACSEEPPLLPPQRSEHKVSMKETLSGSLDCNSSPCLCLHLWSCLLAKLTIC